MKTSELNYDLPEELIAQEPCARRDESRLLVVNRATKTFHEDVFSALPGYLNPGDCVVVNDTRVIRARLHGHKPTGGKVELFLLHEIAPTEWDALVRPSDRVKPGTRIAVAPDLVATVEEVLPEGHRRVVFDAPNVLELLESRGEVPLPPYIKRPQPCSTDAERYQTVYAQQPGAVAAPTAGLHYTPAVMAALQERGIRWATLTLHVGYGTFKPISVENLEDHTVDAEEFIFSEQTASTLNEVRASGGRIVAAGTTSARVLETQFQQGRFCAAVGETRLFIYPPYQFQAVDALQTNFHLPHSSLLALVCAFASRDLILDAYTYAVNARFRFYSYGDSMLIL